MRPNGLSDGRWSYRQILDISVIQDCCYSGHSASDLVGNRPGISGFNDARSDILAQEHGADLFNNDFVGQEVTLNELAELSGNFTPSGRDNGGVWYK